MFKRIEHTEEAISGAENVAEYSKRHQREAGLKYRPLIKKIKAQNVSGRYLEVGAGPGTLAVTIAKEIDDIDITTIDLSPDMAKAGGEHINESGLKGKVRYLVCDASDESEIKKLGKFDLVYSAFSLHHWRDPERVIKNLLNCINDNGILYLYDLKRVWWLYLLPLNGGFVNSIRAAYLPSEVGAFLKKRGITKYETRTHFPYFMQSIIAKK
jgi:ubiquinone/menaquinone biosynthesis C-methylase UbiE